MFRCVCFAGGQIKSTPSIAWRTLCFNLRPPCGGRRLIAVTAAHFYGISIHVLRVEDDKVALKIWRCRLHFNPRPPCGGRLATAVSNWLPDLFQSTSSVWRTTRAADGKGGACSISIHVLRVEDDLCESQHLFFYFLFQSTSSVWRTTRGAGKNGYLAYISIHVLRVEDDRSRPLPPFPGPYFNPRPPCGGRLSLAST